MIGSINMIITRRFRNGLSLILAVAASVLIFGGVFAPNLADASVGIVSRWPATPQIVSNGATGTVSAKFTPATDQNRLMLVAVATEYGAAQSPTFTVTYGGQAVTQIATNVSQNNKLWIGYLKEAGIAAGSAGSKMLTVTTSITTNLTAMYASTAVFSGVDQTTSTGTALTTATAAATSMSLSSLAVTGLTGNTGLSIYVANWNQQTSTPYTGYTEQTDYAGANFNLASNYKMTTAGTEATITSTAAASAAGAMIGVGINPATNVSTNNTCGACHGYPPVDAPGRNIGGMGQFSGSHGKHSGFEFGQAGLVCTKCHYNHTTNNHQSGFKNITGSALPGNAYSAGKKIAVTNVSGAGTCYTAYCHSNGRATVANRKYVPAASTKWGGPATNCRSCHGGRASAFGGYSASKSGFKLSSSHSQHLGKYPAANINCQMCHSMTNITDAWTLRPYSSQARHANGVPDVTFTDIVYGTYTAYKSPSSGSGGTNKTCGNVSCHGGTTRSGWSETTVNNNNTCVHCHGVASYAGAGNTTANRKNFAPGWGGTGTSTDGNSASTDIRVGAHFVHLSSVHMAKLKCTECHTVPDTPFSGTHMALPRYNSQTLTFAQATSAKFNGVQTSYTSGTSVKAATCSTVYCHGAKMRNGDTSGSYRKPSWNMDYLTGNAPDITTCGRCHGVPPIFGTTSSLHGGKTLADCTTCHTSVVDATGKIKNKALHINGKLEAPGSPCNGCHSAKSNDTYFAFPYSAHKLHIYTSMKWADYQDATETNLALRSSPAAVADTYKFKCGVCHNSDATRPTYATHMNANSSGDLAANQSTQIYFGYYTTAGKTTGYVAGGSLAGTDTKGTGKTWTAGNGTSCATTYCHSNGQEGANFIGGQSVLWSTTSRTATPDRCKLCHGGARGSSNPMNSGKHNRHMNNWTTMGISLFTCRSCHAGTVSDNTTILPTSLRHVNKQKNYSGLYAGDNYNPIAKTCTTFYCHSDSKGRFVDPGGWFIGTTPKKCDGCHGRSPFNGGQFSNTSGLGYPNYTSTGKATFRANSHPKHVKQLGITDTRGCAKCHASTADRNFANRQHPLSSNHLDGNTSADLKPDRTAGISFTYATATKTCNSASCHKSGRIDKSLFANVQWGDTGTCRMCHGNRNSAFGGYSFSRSGYNLSTSHRAHLKYPAQDINCQTCHYKTAADAASFKQYTGALYHNNNKRNVYLAPTYGSYSAFKSISSSNAPIPATNTKNCSNTSCHGGITRNSWQKNTYNGDNTCVHCHGSAGTSAALPNTAANRKNFAPGWKGTGVSTDGNSSSANIRVGAHFKHLSSAYMKIRTCSECHAVPDTPFGGTHFEAKRFNSQTLSFNQASTATIVIGVAVGATPAVMAPGSFTGYTSGTAVKAATCSSTYCHGGRMKTGDTSGTYKKPYWNYSAMINYSDPTVACGRCHGAPPSSGTAAATHVGATLSGATPCSGCHPNVVNSTGKIINKSLHINGVVDAASDCTGCHAIANTDFVKASRHVTNGTATNIVTAYDCIVCHAEGVAQATGVTRSDLHSGTGTTTGVVDLRNVDNVSQLQTGGTSGSNYLPWPHRRANAALAKGATNTTNRNNMDTFCLNCHDDNGASGIAVNNSNDGLVLSGLNTTVRTVTTAKGGTNSNTLNATVAQRPFNTEDNLQNVNDKALSGNGTSTIGTFRTSSYGRVLNVKSQFNSGNAAGPAWASHHNLNQYTKRYTSNNTAAGTGGMTSVAWTAYVTKENITMNSTTGGAIAGLHCSDCHLNEVNAHGSTNAWYMLINTGTVAPFDETADVAPTLSGTSGAATSTACNHCHFMGAYGVGGTAVTVNHYPHDTRCNNVDVITGTAIESPFGNQCHACHGGFGNTADTTNKDSIGTGTVKVGRGPLGTIHGNNEDYNPAGGGTPSKRYRFMSGATMRFYNPNGTTAYSGTANWETSAGTGCYTIGSGAEDTWAGGCTSHSGGASGDPKNSNRKLTY